MLQVLVIEELVVFSRFLTAPLPLFIVINDYESGF
jgi:hypothetical protein